MVRHDRAHNVVAKRLDRQKVESRLPYCHRSLLYVVKYKRLGWMRKHPNEPNQSSNLFRRLSQWLLGTLPYRYFPINNWGGLGPNLRLAILLDAGNGRLAAIKTDTALSQ